MKGTTLLKSILLFLIFSGCFVGLWGEGLLVLDFQGIMACLVVVMIFGVPFWIFLSENID